MLSVSDSYYIRMIVYVLRAAHGERGAVHSFFELLRVSHILSGLEEHCSSILLNRENTAKSRCGYARRLN